MSELKLIVDIRSMPNGGQLIARAGTVVDFLRDFGYGSENPMDAIAQLKDGSVSFPLDASEYEMVDDGRHSRQEMAPAEDSIYLDRGKPAKPKKFDLTRKLAVGSYLPSQKFRYMGEMTAVFFEDTMGLVAVTGHISDPESEEYAQLFANAPELAQAKGELLAALRIAERTLQKKWDEEIEAMNLKPGMAIIFSTNPGLASNTTGKKGRQFHPTAAALATVRNTLLKYGAI